MVDEKRGGRPRADARGLVGVPLDRRPRRPGGDAGGEGGVVQSHRVRNGEQIRAGVGLAGPGGLALVERVVHLPEASLAGGTHGDLGRGHGVAVHGEREVHEHPAHLPRADVFLSYSPERRQGELAAGGALKIAELEHRDRCVGAAQAAGGGSIGVLPGPPRARQQGEGGGPHGGEGDAADAHLRAQKSRLTLGT